MRQRFGSTAQKILLLLLGGAALGLSGSPTRYNRVLKSMGREWKEINRRELYRAIRKLYESKLIKEVHNDDGSIELVLNKHGREIALKYKLEEIKIPAPKQWDRKWRVVIFDVPVDKKGLRDTLRLRFLQLGLLTLQKSVFVHPYPCNNEIDFIIELYDARRFVRFIEATHIDNELHLKKKFNLL